MRIYRFILLSICCFFLKLIKVEAQTTIDLSDGTNLVISGGNAITPVYVVVDNSATTAITTSGTGGSIVAEGEYNILQWNIATGTGIYTVPLGDASNNKIPLSVNVTNAGVGASGNIQFSCIPGPDYLNSSYMPSDVTNVNHNGSDNSTKVIDRFWIIDAQSYTTKPDVTLSFTYTDAEYTALNNAITEANLQAQSWNSTTSKWRSPAGSVNTATNQVSSIAVPSANFSRSWTLVDNSSPLPIELVYFKATCNGDYIKFDWATASEYNNKYFVLEKSIDNQHFIKIDSIKGKIYSNNVSKYSYQMLGQDLNQYYRITQVDLDGHKESYQSIALNCNENNLLSFFNAYSESNDVIKINSFIKDESDYKISITDIKGGIIFQDVKKLSSGNQQIEIKTPSISTGMYFIQMQGGNDFWNQKIILN